MMISMPWKLRELILNLSCDDEAAMGFTCNIMPMLKVVHELIKFAKSCNTFVWEL
jgi:hypothetical protein